MPTIVSTYLREFKGKYLPLILSLVVSSILLSDLYYSITNKAIIEPLKIDKIAHGAQYDAFFGFWLIANLTYWGYNIVKRRLIPDINSVILIGVFLFWYIILFRNSRVVLVSFTKFEFIYYSDVLFFSFLSFITKFKYFQGSSTLPVLGYGFIEDKYSGESSSDKLGREKYAVELGCQILLTHNPEAAFVVAINSPWGYGKSAFLILVEKFLLEGHKEFNGSRNSFSLNYGEDKINLIRRAPKSVIVNYNPWKNFDSKKIIEDFFNELSAGIKKYDAHIAIDLKKYATSLTKLSESSLKKILEVSIDNFYEDSSLTKAYEQINNSLNRIGRKIIIFIDDLDRLTGEELIDVIKLVRNTANFRNTFFILAYDHNYVLNTIEKRSLVSNKEEYLQKIIQLEVNLPPIHRNILLEILFDKLSDFIQIDDRTEIKNVINETTNIHVEIVNIHKKPDLTQNPPNLEELRLVGSKINENLFFRIFGNVRDIIRFSNSFKLTYNLIGSSTDVHDIIYLELLKIKFLSVFQLITRTAFLGSRGDKYEFNDSEFDNYFESSVCNSLNVKVSDLPVVKVILYEIFNSKRKRFFRSVVYPKYFDFYFTYQIPNVVSLQKIEDAFSSGPIAIEGLIDEAISDESIYDLISYLNSQNDFVDIIYFQNVLIALFYISNYGDKIQYSTIQQIKTLIGNKSLIDKLYPNKKEEFISFLRTILQDSKYDLFAQADVAGDDLYRLVSREFKSIDDMHNRITINDKEFLQKVLCNCLERVIQLRKGFDRDVMSIYLKNLQDIAENTRRLKITDQANSIMRKRLAEYPYSYLSRLFIRYAYLPPGDEFVFDPFIFDYFGTLEEINLYLNTTEVRDSFMKTDEDNLFYRLILVKFKGYVNSGNNPIRITDLDELKIVKKYIGLK